MVGLNNEYIITSISIFICLEPGPSVAAHAAGPTLLGMCNSGDTAGDRSRVVGYASIAWHEGVS